VPNQEKSDIFKPSKFEPLYQAYFGFWLLGWSRCGRIVNKSSRIDSWDQVYSVLLTSALVPSHRRPSEFAPKTETFKRKPCLCWLKELVTKLQKSCRFVISIETGSLLVVFKVSIRSLSLRRNWFWAHTCTRQSRETKAYTHIHACARVETVFNTLLYEPNGMMISVW